MRVTAERMSMRRARVRVVAERVRVATERVSVRCCSVRMAAHRVSVRTAARGAIICVHSGVTITRAHAAISAVVIRGSVIISTISDNAAMLMTWNF